MDLIKTRVDRTLDSFLADQRKELNTIEPRALPALDELARLLAAGGKRLRPQFCYWGYRSAGGADDDRIIRASAALELLHTFALIHDDVMDRSELRRGISSAHIHLGQGHYGVSAAILAGDLAFVLADRLFFDSGFPNPLEAFGWFTTMRFEVVAGQYADIEAARSGSIDEGQARRIAALKSGAYTVSRPLAIGAALAGASPRMIEDLTAFGDPLGEAFQLRDDVLGTFGDERVTGKDAHADLREGKRTVLIAKARELVSPNDRAFLDERLGTDDMSDAEADRIRSLLRDSGALQSTIALIDQLSSNAIKALEQAQMPEVAREALRSLCKQSVRRDQ